MSWIDLFLIAVGLSADAFAVALSVGLCMTQSKWKKAVTVGLYFGAFQAGMPAAGYFLATRFTEYIDAYGHWVAFGLLSLLGIKMIAGSFKKKREECPAEEASVAPLKIIPLAFATSVDALAVGASFAFLHVDIIPAAAFIGAITFALSVLGVRIGSAFGAKLQSKANLAGGVILLLIGIRILIV
jgi:putative Mn2+ efflux pump MntP